MTTAAAPLTNWPNAMDFHAAMTCQAAVPAFARCALDRTLRSSTRNWCSLLCSTRRASDDGRHPQDRALQRRRDAADGGDCTSCTRLVQWTPRVPASPALPALPHTQYTHTQSHNRRATAAVSAPGGAAGTQRSSGAAGERRRRVRPANMRRRVRPANMRLRPRFRRANRSRRRWQQQRRATSSSASRCRYEYGNDDGRLHQGKGSARALHPAAGGPRSTKRAPSTAIELQGVGQARAACDLEGNRAGLGCLEHLRNALSFAVVTEWPVRVYPPRLPGSPPHVRRVRADAVTIQPACVVCTRGPK